jgi:Txe/YoeB family toxin of toxin-antitoxin system
MWRIVFTKQAQKDAAKIKVSGLKPKVEELLTIITADPFATPPSFEKLRGDLLGLFSRRINIHHRLVYQVYREEKVVKILSMWTHYE